MVAKEPHRLMRDRAPELLPAVADRLRQATESLDNHDPASAESALVAVLQLAPDCVEARRLLGLVEHIRGDYAQAVVLLRQALEAKPGDALILMNLATSLYAAGEFEVALSSLRRASALVPDFAPAWFNLGRMYMLQERPAGAITALHRALDIEPDHIPARVSLAQAQTVLGAIGPAMASYRDILRTHPAQVNAWMGLAELETGCLTADDVAQLRQAMQRSETSLQERMALGFALVRALEDQGDFDGAMRALHKANAMRGRQLNWNPQIARGRLDTLRDVFATARPGADDARQGEEVVFVVGLPCSGTGMLAKMLAAHPQLTMSHEAPDLKQVLDDESRRRGQAFSDWATLATAEDWTRLGQDYLARTKRYREHTPRFMDIHTHNWQLAGAAMAMLPGARMINARRDPLETCLACYRQLFAEGEEYSFNLDHMASHWHDYDRLSRHWGQLFPGRFVEHTFESWRDDPEVSLQRLLDACGLEPHPDCLALSQAEHTEHTTVAEPPAGRHVRATTRAVRYGARLNGLRALLADAVNPVD